MIVVHQYSTKSDHRINSVMILSQHVHMVTYLSMYSDKHRNDQLTHYDHIHMHMVTLMQAL